MSQLAEPQPSAGSPDRLGVLRVQGADARGFLQGQLSNDVLALSPETSLLAALNTPQGRVVALLRLLERPEALLAILPRTLVGPVITRLRKFVLRSKVTFTDASDDLAIVPFLGTELARLRGGATLPSIAAVESRHLRLGDVSLLLLGGPTPRGLLIGTAAAIAALETTAGAAPASGNDWRLAQIEAGEPQLHPETSELFVAQMLNLDLLGAISFSKGCYTGQEIIARTQHLGRIKRRMLRWRTRGGAQWRRGDSITVPPGRSARIVELARRVDGDIELLAVVSGAGEAPSADAHEAGGQVDALPLPYAVPDTIGG